MLLTEGQLFGVGFLTYLVIWLVMVIRYVFYSYCAKEVRLHRALRLASWASRARKWGWLIFIIGPVFAFLFPWVTIINQNPNIEINEELIKSMEDEVELSRLTIEDVLLRKSFNYQEYCALYSFKGKFLPLGKYLYNNTDSTLNLYWTSFYWYYPVGIDPVEGGTDIPPRGLLKYSDLMEFVDHYFSLPSVVHSRMNRRGGFSSSFTLDVKSVAQKQKIRIREQFTYKGYDPCSVVEELLNSIE